jgi:hypothetical protein
VSSLFNSGPSACTLQVLGPSLLRRAVNREDEHFNALVWRRVDAGSRFASGSGASDPFKIQ